MMKNNLRFIFAVFTKNVSKYFVIPWPLIIDTYCKEKSNQTTLLQKIYYCNKNILKSKNYRARNYTYNN
jgi:hypothetical protein